MEGHSRNRFAVIVGVPTFSDVEFEPLPCAANDAARLFQVLTAYGEFDAANVSVLTQAPQKGILKVECPVRDPRFTEVLSELKRIAEAAGEDSLLLVYFATHGFEVSNVPYLVTADTRGNVLERTAIDVNALNDILRGSRAQCTIRIFDACRVVPPTRGAFSRRMAKGLQDALMLKAKGWASFSSCSTGEFAYEGFGHGVFTKYLCDGLQGLAANQQGDITFEGLVSYVKTSVDNWCKENGHTQTPHIVSDLSGSLVLSRKSTPEPKELPREGHPLVDLDETLRAHLSATKPDIRDLSRTSPEQHNEVADLFFGKVHSLLMDDTLGLHDLTIGESKRDHLQHVGTDAWQAFEQLVRDRKLGNLQPEKLGRKYSFQPVQAVVPPSELFVATARFPVFYWLWMWHVCRVPHLRRVFSPSPPSKHYLRSLKPHAALDELKMDRAVGELLGEALSVLSDWTAQLRQCLEGLNISGDGGVIG